MKPGTPFQRLLYLCLEPETAALAAGPWQCVADCCAALQPSHNQEWGALKGSAGTTKLLPSSDLLSMLPDLLLMRISILVSLDVGLVYILVVHQGLRVVLQGDRPWRECCSWLSTAMRLALRCR